MVHSGAQSYHYYLRIVQCGTCIELIHICFQALYGKSKLGLQYFNTMSVTAVHSIKSVLRGDMLYFKPSYQLTITGTKTNAEPERVLF